MSFLSPLFLIGAIAAAVPILLHLFHRKTEVVIDFPGGQPAEARAGAAASPPPAARAAAARAARRRAAAARAVVRAPVSSPARSAPDSVPLTVIAVDTSMSMTAPGQMDRARAAASRAAVGAAPASHALALDRIRRCRDGHRRADHGSIGDRERDRAAGRRTPRARASAPRWRGRARSSARARATS